MSAPTSDKPDPHSGKGGTGGPWLETLLAPPTPDRARQTRSGNDEDDRRALSGPRWQEMIADLDQAQTNGTALYPDTGQSQEYHLAAQRWASYLHTHPDVVRALVYSPHLLLVGQRNTVEQTTHTPAPTGPAPTGAAPGEDLPGPAPVGVLFASWERERRWRVLAACTDLVWHYLERTAATHSHHGRLLPLAARSRFLVLAHPFRTTAVAQVGVNEDPLKKESGRVFGFDSRAELVRRTHEARQVWATYLDTYQDHPVLAQAVEHSLEAEVCALAFRDGPRSGPLALAWSPVDVEAARTPDGGRLPPPGPEDIAMADRVLQNHLLPRFALSTVRQAVWQARDHRRPRGWMLPVWGALACTIATLILVAAAPFRPLLPYPWVVLPAAGTYLFLGVGVALFGRQWSMPWLLRLPAASAVGLIVLVALHPHWWNQSGPDWPSWPLLFAASLWYLLIEVRNHGVGPAPQYASASPPSTNSLRRGTALWRALAVTGIGAAHAFLIAVIGTVVIAPAFSEDGDKLTAFWAAPDLSSWGLLAGATGWCLAAGVFSQILWDDRPITAPLSHRRWQKGS